MAVGADPYFEPVRQLEIFGVELNQKMIMPIQVLIQNQGARRLRVQYSNIVLEFPGGDDRSPIRADEVIESSPSSSPQGGEGAKRVERILLAPFSWISVTMTDRARLADYRAKELRAAILGTEEAVHGFVYFRLGGKPPGEGHLLVRLVDADDETSVVDIRLPIRLRR